MSSQRPRKPLGSYFRNKSNAPEHTPLRKPSGSYLRPPGIEPAPASPEDTQIDFLGQDTDTGEPIQGSQDETDAFLSQQETPTERERQSETQEPDRYQPPAGYSRLGRDMQTGAHVDITQAARRQGLYLIGLQGYGKSGLLENLIIQDIKQHIGVCVLDPHGELINNIIARLPDREKEEKVILLDLQSKDYYIGLNLFDCADPTDDDEITKTLALVLHVFEKVFGITQANPLMYNLLYKIVYVLIANPGCTMIDMPLFLTNEPFRKKLVAKVTDADVRAFWENWDNPKLKSHRDQEADSQTILNKLNDFSHAPLRYIVGQSTSTIDVQTIMDEGKILLVKLDRRRETATALIGSILVALTLHASSARRTKKQFNLYADEFQNFATEDFATLLEQARKSGIGITMAHQNRSQLNAKNNELETDLKDRTRSTDNLVVFRINRKDADDLAGEFAEEPEEASQDVHVPQKHQRIEEQVEIEVEEDILEVTQDPVDYLVTARGTHVSARVREITQNLLARLAKEAKSTKMLVNNLLVAVMDGIIQVKTDKFIELMQKVAISYANGRWPYGTSPFAENKQFIRILILPPDNQEEIIQQIIENLLIERIYRYKEIWLKQYHPTQCTWEEEIKSWSLSNKKDLISGAEMVGSFVMEITVLAEELAREPIRVPTGKKRLVKRIQPSIHYLTHESEKIQHPRRTEQDMVNEMARRLTKLPLYTARAKVTTKAGLVELTIRTLDPKKEPGNILFGEELEERIARIQESNRTQDESGIRYCRPRHEVKEEIRQRQEQYREPPQEPQDEPPEDEPPVTRRPRN